jgi:hypothetical protein
VFSGENNFSPIYRSFNSANKLGQQITNPEITKNIGPQIANLQTEQFAEGPQI